MASSAAEIGLHIKLLGPVRAEVDGQPVALGGPRQRAVLAFLALRPGRSVPVSAIIDGVWGDDPPESTNAVQVAITRLRNALGDWGISIARTPAGYVIDIEPERVDVSRFEKAIAGPVDAADRRAQLTGALDLWDAEPFEDLSEAPFALPERVRLEEMRLVALQEVVELDLASGMHTTLVPELEGLVTRYPYAEGLWRALMLALYRSGRQAEALAAFQRVRTVLGEDLGLEPGQALFALEDAILRHDPSLDPVSSHRLPRLPTPPNPLVGRRGDVEGLLDLVRSHRLVTLTGPGGVGKTRLALEVAGLLAADFPGGVTLVELAEIRDANLVVSEIARALGAPGDDPWEAIAAISDDAPTLILIDNFEQVVGAAVDIARLLTMNANLHLLATSRSPLRVNAEALYPVAPLDLDEAVTLFMSRARAVRPDFTSEALAGEIAERLDGLPLALELAAAGLRTVPAPDLVVGLRDRFANLRDGPHDLPERHRALSSALEWSCDLLSAGAAELFAELCVFAAPFKLEAAVAVCQTNGDVARTLGELVDASFVSIDGARYRMLETVREFGHTRLTAEGALADLQARHGAWVLEYSRRAHQRLHSDEESEALLDLDQLVPELRAAIAHFVAGNEHESAAEILLSTGNLWLNGPLIVEFARHLDAVAEGNLEGRIAAEVQAARGSLAESFGDVEAGVGLMQGAIDQLRTIAPDSVPFMNALCHMSAVEAESGRAETAFEMADEAVAVARRTGDLASVVMALDNAGYVARTLGDDNRSLTAAEEAVELGRAERSINLAYALAGLARSLEALGRLEEAAAVAEEAVVVADGANSTVQRAAVLTDVGPILARTRPSFAATRLVDAIADQVAMGLVPDALSSVSTLVELVAHDSPREAALLAGAVAARTASPVPPDLESDLREILGESVYRELLASGSRLDLDGVARTAGATVGDVPPSSAVDAEIDADGG